MPPVARQKFQAAANQRIQSTLQTAYQYAMEQRKSWTIATGNARLDSFQNDALTHYTDPNAVDLSIAAGQSEIRHNPAYTPEVAAMKEREFVSTVRYNTGLRMLTDDPKAAEAYFNAHKNEFSGEDQYKFTEALKTPCSMPMCGRTRRAFSKAAPEIRQRRPTRRAFSVPVSVSGASPIGM